MDPLRFLSETRGFFLRREARAAGTADKVLQSGVRRKALVRVRQGAYCHAEVWREMSDAARFLARSRAGYELACGRVALSHASALAAYGCPLWGVPLDRVHLMRLDDATSRYQAGITHHRARLADGDVVDADGWRVTSPARTVVEALGLCSTEAGVVVGDWMLHQGLTTATEVWDTKTRLNQMPGTLSLEVTLRLLDGASESVGDSRNRHLFWVMGLPRPLLQHGIRDEDGRFVAVTDFAWPALGVYGEFDGRVKYGRLLQPGQEPGDAVFAEKRREDDVRRVTGGTMVRWTWDDLHPHSAPSRQLRQLLRPAA
ncbi:hypothetical protein [Nocardioides taihuensis]|uniref:Type IV toxin-antitoxin system AbiEi family antitoxin domain-containing protein n=1 Tax=Nocardioides taihuensis TaxID=1835606 RepID=A0ABW0BJR2_9ACTN